ncbi:MAG: YlzJ-like family protein [Oscillospiraceae bacterium]|nr:YlzJ-like family protein [Oscillospiraceae bacterium]
MPEDMIFNDSQPVYREEVRDGATLVWRCDGGERVLSRVISTRLGDYLKYEVT